MGEHGKEESLCEVIIKSPRCERHEKKGEKRGEPKRTTCVDVQTACKETPLQRKTTAEETKRKCCGLQTNPGNKGLVESRARETDRGTQAERSTGGNAEREVRVQGQATQEQCCGSQ